MKKDCNNDEEQDFSLLEIFQQGFAIQKENNSRVIFMLSINHHLHAIHPNRTFYFSTSHDSKDR